MKNIKKINSNLRKKIFLMFSLITLLILLVGAVAAMTYTYKYIWNDKNKVKLYQPLAPLIKLDSQILEWTDLTLTKLDAKQLSDSYTSESITKAKSSKDSKELIPKILFPQNKDRKTTTEVQGNINDYADTRYMYHKVSLTPQAWEQIKRQDNLMNKFTHLNINYKIVLVHKDNLKISPEQRESDSDSTKKDLVLMDTQSNDFEFILFGLQNNSSSEKKNYLPFDLVMQTTNNDIPISNFHQPYVEKLDNTRNIPLLNTNVKFNRPKLIDNKNKKDCYIKIELTQNVAINKDVFETIKKEIKKKDELTQRKFTGQKIDQLNYEDYLPQHTEISFFYDLTTSDGKDPFSTKGESNTTIYTNRPPSVIWTSDAPSSGSHTNTEQITVTIENANSNSNTHRNN